MLFWEFLPFKCSGSIQPGTDLTRKNIQIDLHEIVWHSYRGRNWFYFETQLTVSRTIMWMSLLHFFPSWCQMLVVTCGSVSCSESLCCELSLMHFFFCQSLSLVISVCIFFNFDTALAQSQDWSVSLIVHFHVLM